MKKKNLILTMLTLVLSIGLLVVTTLAWFSSRPSTIEPVIITTGNLSVTATLDVQWNGTGGTWEPVTTSVEFKDRVPSDELFFRLTITNTGTIPGRLYLDVRNIVYSAGTNGFDWSYDPDTETVVETTNNTYDFSSRLLFKNLTDAQATGYYNFTINNQSLYDNIVEYDVGTGKEHIVLINSTETVDLDAEEVLVLIFSVRFAEDATVLPFEFSETNNVYQSFPEGRPNLAYSTETEYYVSFSFKQFFIRLDQIQP